jgi:hypothetical protein
MLLTLSRLKGKKRQREREREEKSAWGRVVTLHLRGGKDFFSALKVPRQCPLVLLEIKK